MQRIHQTITTLTSPYTKLSYGAGWALFCSVRNVFSFDHWAVTLEYVDLERLPKVSVLPRKNNIESQIYLPNQCQSSLFVSKNEFCQKIRVYSWGIFSIHHCIENRRMQVHWNLEIWFHRSHPLERLMCSHILLSVSSNKSRLQIHTLRP